MAKAISNTSPIYYLHQIGALAWLPLLFSEVWIPAAVIKELELGKQNGCNVPDVVAQSWLHIVEPKTLPSEWLSLDLGPGELAALTLGLENREKVLLLDDALARRIAQSAGLTVWGTLRVLIEGKKCGLTSHISPLIDKLKESGMWISTDIRHRILALANETD